MTNDFIEKYSNYIYGISKKFNGYLNKEDLIQAGFLGLIKAKQNYKEDSNTKFTTYAYPYVIGEMCTLIREDKSIRVNRDIVKLKNAIEKATNFLSQQYLRMPTNLELANFLEVEESEIEKALKTVNLVQSIDISIDSDEKSMNLYDVIPDKETDIDSLISLKEALLKLDDESKKMLLYSLNMNQTELGNIYNMNQVQVSRRLTKIKEKLKKEVT